MGKYLQFWDKIWELFCVISEFEPKNNIYQPKVAINHSNCDFLLHTNLYRNFEFRQNELRNTGYCHYCSSCCCNNVIGALFSEPLLLLVVAKRYSLFRWKCILIRNIDVILMNHQFMAIKIINFISFILTGFHNNGKGGDHHHYE